MWSHSEGPVSARSGGSSRSMMRYENFHDLPIDKQVASASVIAIARYQKDGEKLKCVVSEILKRAPDTDFFFKVGDEYPSCSRYPKSNELYGDGVLMLCVPECFCPLSSTKSYDSAPACWIATQPSGLPPSPGFFDSNPGLTSATGAASAASGNSASGRTNLSISRRP